MFEDSLVEFMRCLCFVACVASVSLCTTVETEQRISSVFEVFENVFIVEHVAALTSVHAFVCRGIFGRVAFLFALPT